MHLVYHHLRITDSSQRNAASSQPQVSHIYTDGSRIKQRIRAAMFCFTNQYVEQRYLGTYSESMVYSRELEAIHMALDHVKL